MSQSLGARLRHRRELQEIALATIAGQTKIKASLLEGLERDDVSQWPSGIFRRSFVRAYADAIGLDAEAVVQEFMTVHPEPDDVAAAAAALTAADSARTHSAPPTRIGAMLRSAMDVISRRSHVQPDPATADDGPAGALPPIPIVAPAATTSSPEPATGERLDDLVDRRTPVNEPGSSDPDLLAVARLCTECGRVDEADDVQPLLREAARILDASGLIVWVWDALAAQLRPALAHGYSRRVLAQLPAVDRDADNPTAAAFRSASAVSASDDTSGALVVPLLTPVGCAGVLALELPRGTEQLGPVCAVATIFAAMLVHLTGDDRSDVRPGAETVAPPAGDFPTPILHAHARG